MDIDFETIAFEETYRVDRVFILTATFYFGQHVIEYGLESELNPCHPIFPIS